MRNGRGEADLPLLSRPRGAVDSGPAAVLAAVESVAVFVRVCVFGFLVDGCEVRPCDPCARVRPCVPCVPVCPGSPRCLFTDRYCTVPCSRLYSRVPYTKDRYWYAKLRAHAAAGSDGHELPAVPDSLWGPSPMLQHASESQLESATFMPAGMHVARARQQQTNMRITVP